MNRVLQIARKLTILICVSFMFPMISLAQEEQATQDLLDMSLEELMNMEITSASKKAEKVSEAPSIISVFSKDQLNTYGWTSFNDVLKYQPGFSEAQDYDRRTISSRGIFEGWNNNHLLMLIDGISFNDNLYGTAYTWEITPLFFAKSIEVLRGPGSALYGSNATNGVTAINTVSAKDLEKNHQARFTIGSFKTRIYDFLSGIQGDNFSMVLGFNAYSSDGNSYNVKKIQYADGSFSDSKINDDRKSSYFFGKIEGHNEFEGLSMQLHRQDWNFNTGNGWLWETPDFKESMKEDRTIITLSYKPKLEGSFSMEYALKYQRHNIDWNVRLYNNSDDPSGNPSGLWEYLNTFTEDFFGRAQFGYDLGSGAGIIAGIELDMFNYIGDDAHYSNMDMKTWEYSPNGEMINAGPYLEWIKDKPIISFSAFAQLSSGELLTKYVKATLGVRYDNQNIKYDAIDLNPVREETKKYNEVSPRIGLIFLPIEDLSIKLLMGKAFRTPSPTEMFGANTYLLASNLRNLKPEYVTTYEAAADWKINANLNLRANAYMTKSENQIAYSTANNNLSTNLYTLSNFGIETELLFGIEKLNGFLNFSYVSRTDEEILDNTISTSKTELTWYPQSSLNLGLSYKIVDLTASVLMHWQGEVKRRSSDNIDPAFKSLRGESVESFFTLDAKVSYPINDNFELSLSAKNLLDKKAFLIKNISYPFDYQIWGRQIYAGINLKI